MYWSDVRGCILARLRVNIYILCYHAVAGKIDSLDACKITQFNTGCPIKQLIEFSYIKQMVNGRAKREDRNF